MTELFIAVSILLDLLPFYILFLLPLRNRLRFSNWINIPVVIVYFLAVEFITSRFVIVDSQATDHLTLSTMGFMAVAVLLCYIFIKGKLIINVFTLFIIKSYNDIIYLVVKTTDLFDFLYQNHTQLEAVVLGKVCLTLATFPLMYIFVRKLLKPAIDNTEALGFWKWLWFIPGLFFICFHIIVYTDFNKLAENIVHSGPFLPYIWIFATFLTYYLILRMLNDAVVGAKMQEELRMAEIQTKLQKKQYDELLEQIEEARAVRHDLRHMLLILDSYAEKDDLENFRTYISQILKEKY